MFHVKHSVGGTGDGAVILADGVGAVLVADGLQQKTGGQRKGHKQHHQRDRKTTDGDPKAADLLLRLQIPGTAALLYCCRNGGTNGDVDGGAGGYREFFHFRQTIGAKDLLILDLSATFHAMHSGHLHTIITVLYNTFSLP